jgi:hypothetical protein
MTTACACWGKLVGEKQNKTDRRVVASPSPLQIEQETAPARTCQVGSWMGTSRPTESGWIGVGLVRICLHVSTLVRDLPRLCPLLVVCMIKHFNMAQGNDRSSMFTITVNKRGNSTSKDGQIFAKGGTKEKQLVPSHRQRSHATNMDSLCDPCPTRIMRGSAMLPSCESDCTHPPPNQLRIFTSAEHRRCARYFERIHRCVAGALSDVTAAVTRR